ncbi:MAG TPA: SufS family cysteine desulfurase [Methylomirabilota bacterium]|nr:SufS family cysteine desulfurase [Methylomirabilota bacterium]
MRLDELTRRDFPILERVVNGHPLIYLDSGASSQKPRAVLEAMNRYYERSHANVHRSIHTLGEEATELYEVARDAVQRFLGAPSREEVVFTRGTTDGLGLIAETIGRTLGKGDEIVVTELEHHSNLIPWQLVAKDRGAVLKAVPVRDDGTLDLAALDRLLTARTRVVAFAHVSNVLGTITPAKEIIGKARAVNALTVVDGAQAAPHMRLDMSALGCDFYVLSAHKMLGPTGIGVMYGRRAVLDRLEPGRGGSEMIKEVWIDHAQWNDLPWRFEPGTPPIAEAVGLTAAIEYLEKLGMDRVAEHERALTRQTMEGLSRIPGVTVYGPPVGVDRGAVVSFAIEGLHPHDVAALLDAEGIAVRAGHHCAMPLMRRLGVVGTTRATFSVFNSPDEVSRLLTTVAGLRSAL